MIPSTFTLLILSIVFSVSPQSRASSKATDELKPSSCETNAALLDIVKQKLLVSAPASVVIVVAHLGKAESSRELNRRRLFNVSLYLQTRLGIELNRIVVADGEKLKGHGRVDIYVDGLLIESLVPQPKRDLCVACCGTYEEFYPDRAKRKIG